MVELRRFMEVKIKLQDKEEKLKLECFCTGNITANKT